MILQEIETSGLDVELESLFSEFFAAGKEAEQAQLRELMGEAPTVKHDPLIKKIAEYQRSGVLPKTGLFMALSNLYKKVGNGASVAPAADEAAPEIEVDFSDDDEAKLRRKLEKEEAKLREKLLTAEKRLRERMAAQKAKRAQRLGLKSAEAQKLAELRGQIKDAQDQRKALGGQIKQLREEMKTIRPTKAQNRDPLTDEDKQLRVAKRRLAKATKENDTVAATEQQAIVSKLQPIVDKQRAARVEAKAAAKAQA